LDGKEVQKLVHGQSTRSSQDLFDQRNETFLEGSQVKGTEHSTAQHSTVEDRKLKEGKMISIIVSLIMSFQE
jgi:hypothetical protein